MLLSSITTKTLSGTISAKAARPASCEISCVFAAVAIHFKDVKDLMRLDYWLFIGTFLYILAYVLVNVFWFKDRRRLVRGLVFGGGLSVVLVIMVVLLDAFRGFGELWYRFHLVFFTNEFWYAEGYMLRLFPQEFFADAAVFCGLFMAVGAVIIGGVGWWLKARH